MILSIGCILEPSGEAKKILILGLSPEILIYLVFFIWGGYLDFKKLSRSFYCAAEVENH